MKTKTLTILAGILILSLITQAVIGMNHNAATYDELDHITSGYSKLITRDFRLYTESPPFADMLFGIPLLFMNVTFPLDHPSWKIKNMNEVSGQFFFIYNKNTDQMLFSARLIPLLLSIIIAFILFFWTKEMFGERAALIALFFYSFEPTIISHSGLTMVDLPFMLFTLLTFYSFWKFFKKKEMKYVLFTGLFLGLAQVTKFSAIFLIPLIGLLFLLTIFSKNYEIDRKQQIIGRNVKNKYVEKLLHAGTLFFITLFITYIIICTAYLFNGVGSPLKKSLYEDVHLNQEKYQFVFDLIQTKPFTVLANVPSPLPYYYIKGFAFNVFEEKAKVKNFGEKKIISLSGSMQTKPFGIFYTLAEFALKVPLPFLFLVLLFILTHTKKLFDREYLILILPVIFYFVWFGISTRAGGVRYIIQTFPFLIILAAKCTQDILDEHLNWKGIFQLGLIFLGVSYALSSIFVSPYYFSYYNNLPDTDKTHLFYDGSLDMGQDFLELTSYLNQNNITHIQINRPIWVEKRYLDKYNLTYEELSCSGIKRKINSEKERHENTYVVKLADKNECATIILETEKKEQTKEINQIKKREQITETEPIKGIGEIREIKQISKTIRVYQ